MFKSCVYCGRTGFKEISRHYPHCNDKKRHDNNRLKQETERKFRQKEEKEKILKQKIKDYMKKKTSEVREQERSRFQEELDRIREISNVSATPVVNNYNVVNNTHHTYNDNRSINIIAVNTEKICKEIDENFNDFLENASKTMHIMRKQGIPKEQIPQLLIESATQAGDERFAQIANALQNGKLDLSDENEDDSKEDGDNEDHVDVEAVEKHADQNLGILQSQLSNCLEQLD